MKRKKITRSILVVIFLLALNSTSSLIGAGIFDFNDGTTQGWTLDQMYVTSSQTKFTPVIGYSLMNSNYELVANTGSLLIGRSDQNDIYLESPDLLSNSNWQGIGGISVDVKRLLYSPGWGDFPNIFFVQLQLRVIDTADNNKEKLFAEHDGSNFIFHDIQTFGHLYHFTWQPSWLSDPRYKVKKIRIRITGPGDVAQELWYRGSWNIDNVMSVGGTQTNNTNPGSNVQVNLGNGVNVTFDTVTGAGNTTLSTSGSGTTPPAGFTIVPLGSPIYYSITTTATFSGNIKIGIQYNDAGLTPQQEAALKLQVYEQPPGQWKNITTSVDINANIIYGTVTHLSEFAVMFSTGGTSEPWVLMNQPTSGTITCFTVSGTQLFAGSEYGGVFVSTNNGNNWNPANTGLTNLTVRALSANSTYTFAGTWGGGVFRTNNSSINWTPVNTGLANLNVTSLYSSGTNLIAGTWGGVFLSTNNGSSWTPINTGLTETHVRAVFIKWGNFFAGTINGLFLSTNNGSNWTSMSTGLTNMAAISLASKPEHTAEELFTGTDGGGVFMITTSTNWNAINSGLSNLHIPFLCFGASNLFAATWGGGVFLTQNPGTTWSAINDGLTNLYIRTLIVNGTNIFAGTDNGGIWRRSLSDLITEAPDIAADPPAWNYGSIVVGSNADKTFVIRNEGTANLNVTGSTLTGANALEFSIQTSGGAFTLTPGSSREIMVKFAPTGPGGKNAALNIASNDPDENPLLISLSGTGNVVTTPDISSDPGSWNYGSVAVGTNSDKTLAIKNDGTANLSITATTITGTNASEFTIQSGGGSFTLAPAATRNIVVRFVPASAGNKSGALRISSNDPDENPFLVNLTGAGTAPATAWEARLTVAGSATFVRTFGGASSATDGYDPGLDVAAAPPAMTYYVYFPLSAFPNYLEKDIRKWQAPYDAVINWPLMITNASGITSNLSWNPAELPPEGSFWLSGGGLNINLRTRNTATVSGNAELVIKYQKMITVTYTFARAGWYLISLPLTPADNHLNILFPTALGAYSFNSATGTYLTVTQLEPKKGYWLLIPGAATATVSGEPLLSFTEHYNTGWHLIGASAGTGLPIADPDDAPNGAVIAIYGWNPNTNTYTAAYPPGSGVLNQGEGYWVAVATACDLTIPGAPPLAKNVATVNADLPQFFQQYGMQPPPPPFIQNAALPSFVSIQNEMSYNYPNPFNPTTTIKYTLSKTGFTSVYVYNTIGQRIRILSEATQPMGVYEVVWDGRNEWGELVPSGIYFYQIATADFVETKKMMLLK